MKNMEIQRFSNKSWRKLDKSKWTFTTMNLMKYSQIQLQSLSTIFLSVVALKDRRIAAGRSLVVH